MSGSQANSIEEQLEERRQRMRQSANANSHDRQSENKNNQAEPMDVDGPFADDRHRLEQDIVSLSSREHELQSQLESAQNELLSQRARLNILRQADAQLPTSSQRDEAPRPDQPTLTQEEKDFEIAMQLQRQFERDAQPPRRDAPPEASAASAPPPSLGSGFSFSFSRSSDGGPPSTFSYSSGGGGNHDDIAEEQRRMFEMMSGFGRSPFSGRDPFGDPFGQDPFGRRRIEDEMMMNPFGFGMGGGGMGFWSGRRLPGGSIGFPAMMFGPVGPFGVGGMNIDLDSMDHDQILRLQEMIGHVPRGATAQQLSELPTSEYQGVAEPDADESAVDVNDEKRKCSICLEQFEGGDEIKTLPCFHIFHADEIDKWLQQNSVCPICRVPIQSRDAADVPDAPPRS